MGCFSFICQRSGEPVLSDSSSGDAVHLFLLQDGKVIEYMHGNYDSYGRVFGFEWSMDWDEVCKLMFQSDESNGIAAILGPFWKKGDSYPSVRSERDPNQGWGEHDYTFIAEHPGVESIIELPFHIVFKNKRPHA